MSPDPVIVGGRHRGVVVLPDEPDDVLLDTMHAAGVRGVHGGQWCTYADAGRFFSYRRDRITGRMGAFLWLEG